MGIDELDSQDGYKVKEQPGRKWGLHHGPVDDQFRRGSEFLNRGFNVVRERRKAWKQL